MSCCATVADPGFPMGKGANLVGGANSRHDFVSYVKTKESGPSGGGDQGRALGAAPMDPPMGYHLIAAGDTIKISIVFMEMHWRTMSVRECTFDELFTGQ